MSLLTVERNSPSPHESDENEDVLSCSSIEGFVAKEHYAVGLPSRPWTSLSKNGEQLRIFSHLKKLVNILRPVDDLRLAVELENSLYRSVTKYLVIITTTGIQDTEETLVLGTEQDGSNIRICLVFPLWRDTQIKLDGDGGFSVHTGDQQRNFKPISVQSMWTALQALYKATDQARLYNYYIGGLSHTWISYYHSHTTEDWSIRNEWSKLEDMINSRSDSPIFSLDENLSDEKKQFERHLVNNLRSVMLHVDLEEVSSRQLRLRLEEEMRLNLNEYRGFLDEHMLIILGQMESPSQIFDYLYLGTEWNASNLEELKTLGVSAILNITREIDNFYPEFFKYSNIRLYDVPNSELIRHWDKTYTFIKTAKEEGKKVLVHCRMGISRSAATVIAYAMKEYSWPLDKALGYVKSRRSCINPNKGFMSQLKSYEGILGARHNKLWGVKAPSRILSSFQRSMSDPNLLKESATTEMVDAAMAAVVAKEEGGQLPLLQFKEEGITDDEKLRAQSTSPFFGKNGPLSSASDNWTPHHHHHHQPQHVTLPLTHSTPVYKKVEHFLASIRPTEDDQGLGDNIGTSESGSGFSSPILTPPDEEFLSELKRKGKECARMRFLSSDSETVNPEGMEEGSSTTKLRDSNGKHEECTAVQSPNFPEQRHPLVAAAISSTGNSSRGQTHARSTSLPMNKSVEVVAVVAAAARLESQSPIPEALHTPDEVDGGEACCDGNGSGLPILQQHRRCKSADTTGPIKTKQISSVPERVKEIEELNAQQVSSAAKLTTIERQQQQNTDFFIGSSPTKSGLKDTSLSSSEESLHSSYDSQTSNESSPPPPNYMPSSSPPLTATRHASLSPRPSCEGNPSSSNHLSQSTFSLPRDVELSEKMQKRAVKAIISSIEKTRRESAACILDRHSPPPVTCPQRRASSSVDTVDIERPSSVTCSQTRGEGEQGPKLFAPHQAILSGSMSVENMASISTVKQLKKKFEEEEEEEEEESSSKTLKRWSSLRDNNKQPSAPSYQQHLQQASSSRTVHKPQFIEMGQKHKVKLLSPSPAPLSPPPPQSQEGGVGTGAPPKGEGQGEGETEEQNRRCITTLGPVQPAKQEEDFQAKVEKFELLKQ